MNIVVLLSVCIVSTAVNSHSFSITTSTTTITTATTTTTTTTTTTIITIITTIATPITLRVAIVFKAKS
uniref:Uncharacterized protein n=1 Tax=Glossina palpalis gambiensis TaxID=67801 RepID=A0A1B0BB32_9MUSC